MQRTLVNIPISEYADIRPPKNALNETERLSLLAKIPEKARRERQERLTKFGLDAPDVYGAVHVYRKTILEMDKALINSNWIGGDSFSLADACLAPYLQTIMQFGWMEMLDGSPRVSNWFQQCRNRDSYQISVADDFSPDVQKDLLEIGGNAWDIIQRHLKN